VRLPGRTDTERMLRARRESILATILFTDIVGSSNLIAEVGDRRWKILLARHNALVRRELRRYGGRELDTAGDGFFASFDNPGNAVRCAAAIVETVQDLGIDVRIGLHLGQAEKMGRKLGGVAVHIAARVMALAGPAEVLMTGVVQDVLPSSDFTSEDRGSHVLKGVSRDWRLFRVVAVEKPLPGPLEPGVAAERRAAVQAPPLWRRNYVPTVAALTVLVVGGVAGALLLGSDSSQSPRAPVDYVARVDPATRQVVARTPVGEHPLDVALGEGSVWVLDKDGSVRRIDPVTNEATVIGTAAADPRAIAAGEGGIWIADGTKGVIRIDPASNRVTASFRMEGVAQDVSVGEGAVWVATPHQLVRIDPSSGQISESEAPGMGAELESEVRFRTAVGDGFVWRTVSEESTALRYEVTRDRFDRFDVGVQPRDIAASGGDVWLVACGTPGTVVRLDAQTGDVSASIPAGGAVCQYQYLATGNPISIAEGAGGVWVTDALNGTISKISETTNQVDPPIRVGETATAIVVGLGSVWVAVDGEASPSPSTS
jgi:class 3 adenylate cyclase/DNA-binding beta-propeller fold protein YncE